MSTNAKQDAGTRNRETASGFERARRVVGIALSDSLEALGERLREGLSTTSAAARVDEHPKARLRHVLSRDRTQLAVDARAQQRVPQPPVAAEPPSAAPSPAPAVAATGAVTAREVALAAASAAPAPAVAAASAREVALAAAIAVPAPFPGVALTDEATLGATGALGPAPASAANPGVSRGVLAPAAVSPGSGATIPPLPASWMAAVAAAQGQTAPAVTPPAAPPRKSAVPPPLPRKTVTAGGRAEPSAADSARTELLAADRKAAGRERSEARGVSRIAEQASKAGEHEVLRARALAAAVQEMTLAAAPAVGPAAAAVAPPPPPSAGADDDAEAEPILTRSMARLLASQGHHRRALSIYDAILANGNEEPGLRSEAESLRQLVARSSQEP